MELTKSKKANILIAEDNAVSLRMLTEMLAKMGHKVRTASTGEEALEAIDDTIELAILDLRMPKMSGLDCLKVFRAEYPLLNTIITSSAGLSEAVTAMKLGAYWFMQKPFAREELLNVIARAIEHREMSVQNAELQQSLSIFNDKITLIGKSHALHTMKRDALKIVKEDMPLVIEGEKGTEKLQIARYLHQKLNRKQKPFVVLHLGTKIRSTIESEFFGYESHSTQDPTHSSIGKVELADQGTLYIEDIGEVPIEFQEKLATFIKTNTFMRVGSDITRTVKTRIICGTEHNLESLANRGLILPELYSTLSQCVTLPPLRKRKGDIPVRIQEHFNRIRKRDSLEHDLKITDEALEELMNAPLKGNVTQLENIIESAIIKCKEATIQLEDLILDDVDNTSSGPFVGTLEELEKQTIHATLTATGGNRTEAAKRLGVSQKTMYNKIKKYQLQNF